VRSNTLLSSLVDAIFARATPTQPIANLVRVARKLERLLAPRESRDVRKARELNIPFTMEEIIMSQVEEYNEMLVRTPLSQAQQALIKDIRRRGKNKVCRWGSRCQLFKE